MLLVLHKEVGLQSPDDKPETGSTSPTQSRRASNFNLCDELESKLRKAKLATIDVTEERQRVSALVVSLVSGAKRLIDQLEVGMRFVLEPCFALFVTSDL